MTTELGAQNPIEKDVQNLFCGKHKDPHSILGIHSVGLGQKEIRFWAPRKKKFTFTFQDELVEANRVHPAGLFTYLVGEDVSLVYHDDCHQVLEIKGQSTSVYLSSQENGSWEPDVLHISKENHMFSS